MYALNAENSVSIYIISYMLILELKQKRNTSFWSKYASYKLSCKLSFENNLIFEA